MSRIANYPAGLLSLLGIKNSGDAPGELSPTMLAQLDALPLFQQNNMEHGFALFTPALGIVTQDAITLAAAGEILLTVPAGELWWIENVTLRLNPAAGISYTGQIVLLERPAQATALNDISAVVANPRHVLLKGPIPGFWMTPDTRLAANYDTITGAPGVGSSLMTVRLARYRI